MHFFPTNSKYFIHITYYTFLESIWPDNFKNHEIFLTKEIFFAKCCKYCAKVCTSYLLSIVLSYDILKCRSMKIGVCKTCAKNIIAKLHKMLQNWLKLIWLIFSSHQLYKSIYIVFFCWMKWKNYWFNSHFVAKCVQNVSKYYRLLFSWFSAFLKAIDH